MRGMNRITIDLAKMGGAPCIRDLRLPVETVVRMVVSGMTPDEIMGYYPDLTVEDIGAALQCAPVRDRRALRAEQKTMEIQK